MDTFYLVCAWDGYYPEGGLNNIHLVTFDEQEAKDFREECVRIGIPCPYDKTSDSRYHRDNVVMFTSDQLPWSDK